MYLFWAFQNEIWNEVAMKLRFSRIAEQRKFENNRVVSNYKISLAIHQKLKAKIAPQEPRPDLDDPLPPNFNYITDSFSLFQLRLSQKTENFLI